MKIGLFDSGLGGLTILRATSLVLPQYDYLYFGDTEHLPYGDKTESVIYDLTKIGVTYLFEQGALLVIVACNTASAETVRRLQTEFLPQAYPDRKILGVIVPTVEEILTTAFTKVALIATKRTVESHKYELELNNRGGTDIDLISIATPELVPLIEQNRLSEATTKAISYIKAWAGDSHAIVLGCTHYNQIKEGLKAAFPNKTILAQDEILPLKIKDYLERHPEIENRLSRGATRTVHLTAHRPDYDLIMGHFLGGAFVGE